MKKYRNKQSYSLKSQALNILGIESDGPASATIKDKSQGLSFFYIGQYGRKYVKKDIID